MMGKEYKGRHFIEIDTNAFSTKIPLTSDLFVYLPLNIRMFRVREKGEEIDQATLQHYAKKAYVKFFILDPIKHYVPGEILQGGIKSTNPGIPIEMQRALERLERDHAPKGSKAEEKSEVIGGESNVVQAEQNFEGDPTRQESQNVDGSILEKDQSEQAFSPNAEALEEHKVKGQAEEEDFSKVSAEANAQEEQRVSGNLGDDDVATLVSGEGEEDSTEQKIGGKSLTKNDKKKIGGFGVKSEEEQNFSKDGSNVEEKRFGSSSEKEDAIRIEGSDNDDSLVKLNAGELENEMLRLIKADKKEASKFSTRISSDINELEDKLGNSSAENWNFRNEIKTLGAAEKKWVNWKIGLSEDSPALRGMTKEEKAATKFSHSLGSRLGQLRGELNSSLKEQAVDQESQGDLEQRAQDLKKQIKRMETTGLLLETIDDLDLDLPDLPDDLQGKSKLDLISHLQKEIREFQNTDLLSAADAKALERKLNEVKSKGFGVHGESIDKLRDALNSRLKKVKESGKEMGSTDREKVNALIAKNVKQAKITTNIEREITKKRNELTKLLDQKPKNREEKKANEKKAALLQKEIHELEDLGASVEANETVDLEKIKGFETGIESELQLNLEESTQEGMERVLNWLGNLKEDLATAKINSKAAKERLLAKINGGGDESGDPKAKRILRNEKGEPLEPENSPMLMKLDRLKVDLKNKKEQIIENGEEAPLHLAQTQKKILDDVKRVSMAMNMDVQLNRMRQQLGNVLDKAKAKTSNKAGIEADALAMLKKIQVLEKKKVSLSKGAPLDSEEFREFSKNIEQEFSFKRGENPEKAMSRIIKSIDELKEKAGEASLTADQAKEAVAEKISLSGLTKLKQDSAESKKIERTKLKLARYVEFFLENGRELEPEDLWQIKKLGVKAIEDVEIEINLGKRIIHLDNEIQVLKSKAPETEEEEIVIAGKIEEIQEEIMELKRLGECISKGEEVAEILIEPFKPKKLDEFLFENGKPIPGFEDFNSLETRFKPMDPKKLDEYIMRDRILTPEEKEAEDKKVVFKVDQRIHNLNQEITLVKDKTPKTEEEKRVFAREVQKKNDEIQKLRQVTEALGRGEPVSEFVVEPFRKEVREEAFRFKNEKSTVEQLQLVLDSLEKANEKFIEIEKQTIAVTDEIVFKGSTPEEKEFKKVVTGIDAKMGQAGVYAATLLQAMGYENEQFEEDVIMASYLWNSPVEEVQAGFPGRVSTIHDLAHKNGDSEDMLSQDLAQTLRVICNFVKEPDVITGKFSIDPEVFSRYCEKLETIADPNLDYQLLERVRQAVRRSLHEDERKKLVSKSRIVYQDIGKWRQSQAQNQSKMIDARTTEGKAS